MVLSLESSASSKRVSLRTRISLPHPRDHSRRLVSLGSVAVQPYSHTLPVPGAVLLKRGERRVAYCWQQPLRRPGSTMRASMRHCSSCVVLRSVSDLIGNQHGGSITDGSYVEGAVPAPIMGDGARQPCRRGGAWAEDAEPARARSPSTRSGRCHRRRRGGRRPRGDERRNGLEAVACEQPPGATCGQAGAAMGRRSSRARRRKYRASRTRTGAAAGRVRGSVVSSSGLASIDCP